ncbi:hypothetical protein SAMN04489740_0721 [Arthrobacter alpinus]|uniref:AbiEi antitoxin C-terminal domain-containing protein n=1 Tax=Arthrobacter alpinus TaxID=656366 RepID=A0A1H5GBB9_9MICC|nr:hypothetical protein [Arthrobacter alpinus]SEE13013.1 hypothetical protein SAMN04489740_0721 [Arthrobacter alpinus]
MTDLSASGTDSFLVPGMLLSLAELHAMKLDGVLWPIFADAFRPVGVAESPELRAAALTHQIPASLVRRAALSQLSAAWVYGCAPPPEVISLAQNHTGKSASLPPFSGCTLRQVHLATTDIHHIGQALVTSPLRTAMDVARTAPYGLARDVVVRMGALPSLQCPLGRIRQALGLATHVPGKKRGQALLEELIG